ncbi:cache domain-containing protein [Massilia sp. 9096]|uniref:cache domain-containing protein n=1 Tax=Massilia sp. 9096 TaxID=1500894 RepID=UPI0009DE6CBD|nr:cache domain-containing protein [Massilia sp. 9096]
MLGGEASGSSISEHMLRSSYAQFKKRFILSSSLLIALLAALISWKIAAGVQADRDAALDRTRSFSRAMSAHVESEMRVIDLSLLRSAEALEALGAQALKNKQRAQQILTTSASDSDTSFWIHFIDAHGVGVAASNGLPIAGVSFADREYFRTHLKDDGAGLYVGEPQWGRVSGRRLFFLSRGVFSPEREFLGVVVASVDAAAIASVFGSALFQPTLSITLLHASGKIVARVPLFEQSFATSLFNADFYRHWKAASNGNYEARSPIDGQQRVFSYQKVGDTGLVVIVGIAVDSWRRAIPRDGAIAAGALGIVVLALVLSGRFALRNILRLELSHAEQQRLNAELRTARDERARGEKRARMIADTLPALVSYVDASERYVFHNSLYRTLLGPAADQMDGCSMRDVLGPEIHASIVPEVRAALGGARVSFERAVNVGPSQRCFKFEYTPDVDESGKTLGFTRWGSTSPK